MGRHTAMLQKPKSTKIEMKPQKPVKMTQSSHYNDANSMSKIPFVEIMAWTQQRFIRLHHNFRPLCQNFDMDVLSTNKNAHSISTQNVDYVSLIVQIMASFVKISNAVVSRNELFVAIHVLSRSFLLSS